MVVGTKKKQSIKSESPALAEQRETCHEERDREIESRSKHRYWISFHVSVGVLKGLFAGIVFTAARLVLDPFSGLTPKWGRQSLPVFTLPYLVFDWVSFLYHVCVPTNFQTGIVLLLPLGIGGRNICMSGCSTPAQKNWDLHLFLVILFTVIIHSCLSDLQRVLRPASSLDSWSFGRLSVSIFLSFFLYLSLRRN